MRRTNEYTEFGWWLRTELMKRNLTNREFAAMTGVNSKVVTDVMVGRNKSHQDRMRQALERYDHEKAG